ncbi:TPA: hypothetical protein HA265_03180 [Candidatus Woesearchaeota archaeon]|nr:hypothetical protein [Candidatus Woesearchaeota archaeon]
MELPQYTLHPTIKRMVLPRAIGLLAMAPVFYLGIYINAKLLNIQIPVIVTVLIVAVLLVMISVQGILYYVQFQKYKYMFFTNRVDYEGKKPATFLYANFTEAKLKQNLFDKIFNTGSIILNKEFSLGPISNVTQIKTYLEQLVQYYNFSQQRFRMQQAQQKMRDESAQMAAEKARYSGATATTTGTGSPGTPASGTSTSTAGEEPLDEDISGQGGGSI